MASSYCIYALVLAVSNIVDEDSDNKERYSRLSIVIIETFSNILRDIIQSIIPAKEFYKNYVQNRPYFKMNEQFRLHELQSSNSYDSLDIPFIYKLLRHFSLIPPPTKGWGVDPDNVDVKLADDVERIRHYRNKLAHMINIDIKKAKFDDYFAQFIDIGRRIDLNFPKNFEYKIIGHKTCSMDKQMQIKYENALRELENVQCE